MNPKSSYRQIERLLAHSPTGVSELRFAEHVAEQLVHNGPEEFGCAGAKVYDRRAARWQLRSAWGVFADAPHVELSLVDVAREDYPWVEHPYGAFAVGGAVVVLRFAGNGAANEDRDRTALLAAVQLGVKYHLRRSALEDQLEQARAIQTSLLPAAPPHFGDYDVATAYVPAQSVGGDGYDFLPLAKSALGIVVLDAAGHGLPAALQARDAITGIRMGVERELRASSLVERLNRVIYQSGLSSRFVSLVFAELDSDGSLGYVNAGHPPPLLLGPGGIEELTVGGPVLGPWPDSAYRVGFAHLDRGGSLALFSDGVLEHGTVRGEPFGPSRLRAWLEESRGRESGAAVDDLLARLREVGGVPFEDDVTVVLVRRPESR
ncbi:MAG TPA: PP2C family protein-serine/threonine phosphatase [Candidatus Eisenbacteria bacterium]|nr:PP2C family protein-serine/threonine phosphatase [Candidatus Eisenbacteria bacterium]